MVADLLVTDGRIAGAVGVDTRTGKIYLFKAKAVVVSTGRVNRLSRTVTGVWGNHRVPVNETGDGRAMALRAGVPIINMEFFTPPGYSIGNFELNLGSPRNTVQPAGSVVGPKGEAIIPRTYFYDWDKLRQQKSKSFREPTQVRRGDGSRRCCGLSCTIREKALSIWTSPEALSKRSTILNGLSVTRERVLTSWTT